MSKYIPPGNRLRRDKALFGTDKGQHGPVKIILKNGLPPEEPSGSVSLEEMADWIARQQEQDEQDYTKGCPF